MDDIDVKKTSSKEANYLIKLFKGDIPLVVTYWVFGVLVGGVLIRILIAINEYNYASIALAQFGILYLQSFYWLTIIYSVFILIAIWNSASNYKGGSWGTVAKVLVILNTFAIIGNYIKSDDTDSALDKEIRLLNKGYPVMVDKETRADRIYIKNRHLVYEFTLVNYTLRTLDFDKFTKTMTKNLMKSLCSTQDTRTLIDDDRDFIYAYMGSDNKKITEIIISKSDCK